MVGQCLSLQRASFLNVFGFSPDVSLRELERIDEELVRMGRILIHVEKDSCGNFRRFS